jgi:hypothetical protein
MRKWWECLRPIFPSAAWAADIAGSGQTSEEPSSALQGVLNAGPVERPRT